MKRNKVIKRNNLPTNLPFGGSALWFTVLHYWKAPEWLWGAFGLTFLVIWGTAIWARYNEEKIDLLNNDSE
ncbi:hypothetical protein [Dyadobacter diqingensis]|uniref:hypothetical protein n=1 Tax=Dyadobacter diqingensis TaxID=2938121 RepID=UPI0020C2EF08|nr:hypothetical protein [Dyadobacter diqingensis]